MATYRRCHGHMGSLSEVMLVGDTAVKVERTECNVCVWLPPAITAAGSKGGGD